MFPKKKKLKPGMDWIESMADEAKESPKKEKLESAKQEEKEHPGGKASGIANLLADMMSKRASKKKK